MKRDFLVKGYLSYGPILGRALSKAGTTTRLALSLNLSRWSITRWLKHETTPTLANIWKLQTFVDGDYQGSLIPTHVSKHSEASRKGGSL